MGLLCLLNRSHVSHRRKSFEKTRTGRAFVAVDRIGECVDVERFYEALSEMERVMGSYNAMLM